MKKSWQVALGGLIVAITVIIMFLSSLFPFASLAIPAIASFFIAFALIEAGVINSAIIFVASSILIVILVPNLPQNIPSKILYIIFFGYYPIVKYLIQIKFKIVLQWILKIIFFNYAFATTYFVAANFINIPSKFLQFGMPVLLIASNIVFVIFDIGYSRIISLYLIRIKPYLPKHGGK